MMSTRFLSFPHLSVTFSRKMKTTSEKKEFVLSKQLLRSGTSIGANIAEAIYGSSRKDFTAKLQIAEKEAAETLYWLELLSKCSYIPDKLYQSLRSDCSELLAILSASIRSSSI